MGEQAGMDLVDSPSLDRLQQISGLLQSIEQRLVILASADETLGYPEAAKMAGISERKLSELVNTDRLIDGFHFIRIDAVVRFLPNLARRLFLRPPAAKTRPQAQPHRPKNLPAPRRQDPSGERKKTGTRSSFNPDYCPMRRQEMTAGRKRPASAPCGSLKTCRRAGEMEAGFASAAKGALGRGLPPLCRPRFLADPIISPPRGTCFGEAHRAGAQALGGAANI